MLHILAAESSGGSSIAGFLPLLLIVLAFFFLLVRPQRARQKQMQQTQAALAPGVEIMTTSGMFATVRAIDDDAVTLEMAPGVSARFSRGAIARVIPAETAPTSMTELPPDDRPPA